MTDKFKIEEIVIAKKDNCIDIFKDIRQIEKLNQKQEHIYNITLFGNQRHPFMQSVIKNYIQIGISSRRNAVFIQSGIES